VIFIIDIVINFLSAYYDEDFTIVDDIKVRVYLMSKVSKSRGSTAAHGF